MKKKVRQRKTHKIRISKRDIAYIGFLLIWTAFSILASQYIIGWPMLWLLGNKLAQPFWTCVYLALTYLLAIVIVLIVPPKVIELWRNRHPKSENVKLPDLAPNAAEMGVNKWPTFVDIGLAPIGYIVYLVLSNMLLSFMSIFPWFNANEAQNVGFSYFITDSERVIAMLAIVFIAPIAEELIMRGWLYGKLRNKLNIPIAILLTSLVFGILHGQWNVSVGVFALSIVLCSLREVTGTIWSGMLLHILSNGIAFYILYVAGLGVL